MKATPYIIHLTDKPSIEFLWCYIISNTTRTVLHNSLKPSNRLTKSISANTFYHEKPIRFPHSQVVNWWSGGIAAVETYFLCHENLVL